MSLASQISAGFTAVGNYIRDSILPRLVPTGGTTGHVLTKQVSGFGWAASAGEGGGASGAGVIDLPDGRGVFEWTETIAAVGVAPGDTVLVWLALGEDADENTLDMLDLVAIGGESLIADQLTVTATFSTPTSGPVNVLWRVL